MTPDQYCQEKAARSGSSFYYSFLFLPTEQRRAIVALYAFCREVDDVVDRVGDPGVARAKLEWWREEIERLYAGRPLHPVTRALQPVIERVNLAAEQFQEIIDGMAMDLDIRRYPGWAGLAAAITLVEAGQPVTLFDAAAPRPNNATPCPACGWPVTSLPPATPPRSKVRCAVVYNARFP